MLPALGFLLLGTAGLHAPMKADIRLSGEWGLNLPWRKAGLPKSSWIRTSRLPIKNSLSLDGSFPLFP